MGTFTLNGHTWQDDASDFTGTNGYGYLQPHSATGNPKLTQLFIDALAEMAAAPTVNGVAPGAAGGIVVSNGSAWIRAASATITSAGAATFTSTSAGALTATTGAFSGVITSSSGVFRQTTTDASVQFNGGNANANSAGAGFSMLGNTYVGAGGCMSFYLGNVAGAIMRFQYGASYSDGATMDENGYWKMFSRWACNGATPQAKATLGAASTDLASVVTLANNIRTALVNNGIGQT